MFKCSGSARGDHRNTDRIRNGACQFQIISVLCSIAVHAGEKNLSRTQLLGPDSPFNGIDSRIDTSAAAIDSPAISRRPAPGIDRHHNALASEFFRAFRDQFGPVDGCGIDGDLVGPLTQDCAHIFRRADSPAHCEGYKDSLGNSADHIRHCCPRVAGRGNIQKDQLISSRFGIGLASFHRVARVAQRDKVHTFYYSSPVDIQTGNDSFRQHIRDSPNQQNSHWPSGQ